MNTPTQLTKLSSPTHKISLADFIDFQTQSFLDQYDVSDLTKSHCKKRLRYFSEWIRSNDSEKLDRSLILNYRDFLKKSKFQSTTIGSYLSSLRCYFQWMEIEGLCPDVTKGIKSYKRGRNFRRDALTVNQVHKLLDKIDRSTIEGLRDYALINLLIRTGLRSIEAARVRVSDLRSINSDSIGLWVWGKGKSDASEYVVLVEETLKPIMDYLSTRLSLKQDAYLFASLNRNGGNSSLSTRTIRRIAKERLRAAGLNSPRLVCHSFRHTAVTLSLSSGVPLQEVQKMARHADISTTTLYAHNIDRSKGNAERGISEILKR